MGPSCHPGTPEVPWCEQQRTLCGPREGGNFLEELHPSGTPAMSILLPPWQGLAVAWPTPLGHTRLHGSWAEASDPSNDTGRGASHVFAKTNPWKNVGTFKPVIEGLSLPQVTWGRVLSGKEPRGRCWWRPQAARSCVRAKLSYRTKPPTKWSGTPDSSTRRPGDTDCLFQIPFCLGVNLG